MSAETIVDRTRSMVAEYMGKYDPSHDMHHVERVRRLALHLAKQDGFESVDLEVVELAALCHDIGDAKYANSTDENAVASFLSRQGYPKADLVGRIVRHIGFRKELGWNDEKDDPEEVQWRNTCKELHVVQDADKLDALGAFGILRCAAYSGAKNIPLHVPGMEAISILTKDAYEQQTKAKTGTAVLHFHEKLFKLVDMMRTRRGRVLAQERDQYMREFINRIEQEENMLL